MKQIIASVFFEHYLILLGITFFVFFIWNIIFCIFCNNYNCKGKQLPFLFFYYILKLI